MPRQSPLWTADLSLVVLRYRGEQAPDVSAPLARAKSEPQQRAVGRKSGPASDGKRGGRGAQVHSSCSVDLVGQGLFRMRDVVGLRV